MNFFGKISILLFLTSILIYSCKHKPDPVPIDDGGIIVEDSCEVAPSVLVDSVLNIQCGAGKGKVFLSASGGTGGDYTYSIDGSNYQVADTFGNLNSGTYTVYVKDSAGCVGTSTATVNNITGMTVVLTIDSTSCSSTNGKILASVSGGVSPYQFSIDGVTYQNDSLFTGLAVGSYTIRVKDASNCIASKVGSVEDNGNVSYDTVLTHSDCGLSNGKIQIKITDGDAPFQFSIDNGSTYQSDSLFTNLGAGSYDVVVQDNSGCSKVMSVTLNELPSSLDFTTTDTDPDCSDLNGGVITVNATGGAGSYQYKIDAGSYSGTNSFTSLSQGNYSISIKDANGCEVTKSVTLTASVPSYSSTIATIFTSNCTGCHSQYNNHSSIAGNKTNIRDRINRIIGSIGHMPKNGSLTTQQIADLNCWIDAGAPNN